ncbi:thioredoxin family protein [Terriglobus aquaticus]|uniref:Thioredoxin family protein n=1 Tax=Terriglobus aquaticus TaxID=940139 RepID=A0ABW9KNA2_9BACT|nr:thioredoxin family protein [Terriglobus aquaticus]
MTISGRVLLSAVLLSSLGLAAPPAPAVAQMAPPMVRAHIYDDNADARKDIAAAVAQARREHKRVIVDFGGDWCGDCQVLDIYFHQPQNQALLQKYFVLVHASVGHIDKNLDIPIGYGVNIKKGVPALAVLDSRGKVVYAQATGEFENMRNMNSSSVTEFLNKWKA